MKNEILVMEHFDFTCLGHLGEYLDSKSLKYDSVKYSDVDDDFLSRHQGSEALILLGSPDSVNDNAKPWVARVRRLAQEHIQAGKPAFGICFGAQMLASALGGEVARLDESRVGFMQLGRADMEPYSGNWMCFHEEYILPHQALDPFFVDMDTIYAFRKDNIIGLQFHPEMDDETIKRIIENIDSESAHYDMLHSSIKNYDFSTRQRSYELFDNIINDIFNIKNPPHEKQ